jgi:dihydroneopterin aldolase/2-amino-4-hydroxy-6-hydroxymethyldihydropteridine diphosphokinase
MYSEWAKDEIRIEGLKVFAHHGVLPEETRDGQFFYVNAVLFLDTSKAGREDDLTYSVHYGEVSQFITDWMQENPCLLLETVCEKLAKEILRKYDLICALDLEVRKPHAPIPLPFGCVSVKVHRSWHKAYIALGSNMGDKEKYLADAQDALENHPDIVVKRVSDFLVTAPYGGVEQEDFLNGVMEIETILNPEELLDALHEIENAADRKRTLRWGPRTLDLDILLYDKLVYESATLNIPHVDMQNRRFVLEPMVQIAPYAYHPVTGKCMKVLLEEL